MAIAKDESVAPYQIAELASAVGTLEIEHGAVKSARKLFKTSLRNPTDNSLAQVSFWQRHVGELEVDESRLAIPRAYEARAWSDYQVGKWSDVVAACRAWMLDEPFSARPAMLGSYTALVSIGAPKEAERLLNAALRANSDDAGLHNNLAVALAEQDRTAEAEKALDRALLLESEPFIREVILGATMGLVAFRKGETDEGRAFYLEAIEAARRHKDDRRARLASVTMLREETLAGTIAVDEALRMIREEVKTSGQDISAFVSTMERARAEQPNAAAED